MSGRKKDTSIPVVERAAQSTTAVAMTTTVCYAYGLNVRDNPSTEAQVIRVLKDGEQIKVDNNIVSPRGWVAVVGGGFVMKQYLK